IFQLKDIIEGYNGGNQLPEGTEIRFAQGKDEYAFDTTAEHYYRIRSVDVPGYHVKPLPADKSICVKLSFEDKRSCDDRINYNYSDYINPTDIKLTDLRDRAAVLNYNNHGIPYFMFGVMDTFVTNGKKTRGNKMRKKELFSWKEEANNWYSYEAKPNTQDFGIDCSGLVVNSLLGIKDVSGSVIKFYSTVSSDELDINASMMGGLDNSRQITVVDNKLSNSFVQEGDIVYAVGKYKHIGVCNEGNVVRTFNNTYAQTEIIAGEEKINLYSNVIHNYGESFVRVTNKKKVTSSFYCKTLNGPIYHWSIDNLLYSRIYLWR
nr:hypothetical protein [Treponema sp.]